MSRSFILLAVVLVNPSFSWAQVDEGRTCLLRAWMDDFSLDRGWDAEPWTLQSPATSFSSRFGSDGGVFQVTGVGQQMKWTRLIEPIWVSSFPFVQIKYELVGHGGSQSAALVFSDDSTGPVTPGAMNPENPLASGGGASIFLDGSTEKVLDLRTVYKSDRIARMCIALQSEQQPMSLKIHEMSFWAVDPTTLDSDAASKPSETWTTSPASSLDGDEHSVSQWEPLPNPDGRRVDVPSLKRWVTDVEASGIDQQYLRQIVRDGVAATGIFEQEELIWTGDFQGERLALLLGVRLFGSGKCWLGGDPPVRTEVTSPHELLLRIEYADGTTTTCFPTAAQAARPIQKNRPELCIVPLDPTRRVRRIALADRMSYGQVLAFGASIDAQPCASQAKAVAPGSTASTHASPSSQPVRIEQTDSHIGIHTAGMSLQINPQRLEIESLKLVGDDHELLSRPVTLMKILDEHNNPIAFGKSVKSKPQDARIEFEWQIDAPTHRVISTCRIEPDGALGLECQLVNESEQPWKFSCILPELAGLRVSEIEKNRCYLLGTVSTLLDNRAVKIDLPHSGDWPLQMMDVFDGERGGGLGLLIEDQDFQAKRFAFQQDESGASMAVKYVGLEIPAGQSLKLPTTILLPHSGDWHDVFARYRHWTRQLRPERARRLEGMFYCRRDYPLGGTGLLWEPATQAYSVDRLIAESRAGFGGIDMIDISGWAYNEAVGRVGEYLNNDLGGLPALRDAARAAHAQNVKVGLYFEGYLLDRRCELGKKALAGWQLVGQDGKGKWWSGEMELFTCPAVPAWRQELTRVVTEVARQTEADAVYLDEFGISGPDKQCYDRTHGHPVPSNPPLEESRTLKQLRHSLDAVNPHIAIYVEFTPADTTMRFVDAAFDYGMTLGDSPRHPTSLPLHRFAFTDLRFVEMIGFGIRPVPIGEDDLHRCFFHGMSLWLKGRSQAWFSSGFRQTAQNMSRVLSQHAATFHGDACEPLIPTLVPGLYANSFRTASEQIITLYNANFASVAGPLIRLKASGSNATVKDLLRDSPSDCTKDDIMLTISGQVEPRSAAAFCVTNP